MQRKRRPLEQRRYYRERHGKAVKMVRVPIDGAVNWLELEYPGRFDVENLDELGRLIGAVLAGSARL